MENIFHVKATKTIVLFLAVFFCLELGAQKIGDLVPPRPDACPGATLLVNMDNKPVYAYEDTTYCLNGNTVTLWNDCFTEAVVFESVVAGCTLDKSSVEQCVIDILPDDISSDSGSYTVINDTTANITIFLTDGSSFNFDTPLGAPINCDDIADCFDVSTEAINSGDTTYFIQTTSIGSATWIDSTYDTRDGYHIYMDIPDDWDGTSTIVGPNGEVVSPPPGTLPGSTIGVDFDGAGSQTDVQCIADPWKHECAWSNRQFHSNYDTFIRTGNNSAIATYNTHAGIVEIEFTWGGDWDSDMPTLNSPSANITGTIPTGGTAWHEVRIVTMERHMTSGGCESIFALLHASTGLDELIEISYEKTGTRGAGFYASNPFFDWELANVTYTINAEGETVIDAGQSGGLFGQLINNSQVGDGHRITIYNPKDVDEFVGIETSLISYIPIDIWTNCCTGEVEQLYEDGSTAPSSGDGRPLYDHTTWNN